MLAIAPGCKVEVERGPDWLLVKIANLDTDISDSPPLAESLWALLQQHLTHRLVLELDEVSVLNSYLIGQLITLYKRIHDHGGVMRLCGLSAYNRQVLHSCRLDDRLPAYQDRQDAVMAGCRFERPR